MIIQATKGVNAMNILNDLEMHCEEHEQTIMTKTTPCTFIERYCSKLNVNQELTKLCLFIGQKVKQRNLIPKIHLIQSQQE